MTTAERESLVQICRMRARVAKGEANTVAAGRKADFEAQLAREYSYDEQAVWKKAAEIAANACELANAEIARCSAELGIPRQFAPSLTHPYWRDRG